MKRRLLVLCLVSIMLLLAGCGEKKEESGEKAASGEKTEVKTVSLQDAVRAAALDADALIPLSAEDLSDDLGIEAGDYTDFVFLQSTGMDGREILAVRASGAEAAGKIAEAAESYLERRRDEARNYAPDAYRLLTEASVRTKGNTVVLIVGPDAGKETDALLAGE